MINMFVKGEFSVKYKAQVFPRILGLKDWTPESREIERRGVERAMGSVKVKYFSFRMFDNETKTI